MQKTQSKRALFKQIAALSWPTIVEQALQTIVQYADAAMVGRVGAIASACVGMTTSVTWLVNSSMFAIGVGVQAVISQAMGAGQEKKARRAGTQAIFLALILGLMLGAVTLTVGPVLPAWLGAEESLRAPASAYFMIICAPMLFRASIIVFGSVLRAVKDMRTPMVVNTLVNVINMVLNFFLIFPTREMAIGPATITMPGAGLGVTGAAVATAIAYVVGGTLMFIALLGNRDVTPRGIPLKLDRELFGACVRVGLPVALTRVVTCMGYVVFSSQVTRLGTTALAAHSLANTAEQAFYIPGYGMQAAAATLSGNALGAKDEKKLTQTAYMFTVLCAALMTVSGLILFMVPEAMMRLFTTDAAVIEAGVSVLRIVALSEPFFGASIILEGVFNGIGDTRTPMLSNTASMWGIRIFFTFICVSVLGLGLRAVWCCMVAGNVINCMILLWRFRSGRWKKAVGLQ